MFNTAVPSRFTLEISAKFPKMPHNMGDLPKRRAGITLADSTGRGVSVYFATTGVAVSRVDDFGSVTALPDTTETTEEISTETRTLRVAVDGALGRAYVYIGNADGVTPEIRYIIPVEATPTGVSDTFKVFVSGLSAEPSRVEISALRLASELVIPNFPPTAIAGPDRVGPSGQAIRLDGRASFDIEGAALSYLWRVFDVPYGSVYGVDLSSGTTTDDGDADGVTTTFGFTSGSLPAWVVAGDVLLIAGVRAVILSVDNPGGQLVVTQDVVPDNLGGAPFRIIRQSLLIASDTETPYFVPDTVGIYRFELVVNDGESDSEPAEVLASIVSSRAPFGAEPDVSPIWKGLGDDWGFVENRGVFEEAWRGAAQILSGKLLEVWQYHYNYSLRDAQRVFQRKWLAYRTMIEETDHSSVVISARHGSIQAGHAFEVSIPAVTGETLVFEYPTGETPESVASTVVVLTSDALPQIISDVNVALAGTGITAYSHGIRTTAPTCVHSGTLGSTTDDGDGDGFTATFSFPAMSLPSWIGAGDSLVIPEVGRYTVATVNNPGGSLTVTAEDIPDALISVAFRIFRHCRLSFRAPRAFRILASSTAASELGIEARYNYLSGGSGATITDRTYFAGDGVDLSWHGVSRYDLLVLNNGQSFVIDRTIDHHDDPLPNQRILLSEKLPLDASADWEIPSVVRSSEVDYEALGSYPGDLVKGEAYAYATATVSDVRGTVVAQKNNQVAARLDGFFGSLMEPTDFETRLLGVKRRKALPIYADTVSIPRLQDKVPVVASPTVWAENVDYILEPLYREVDGSAIPMLQFRDSVFITPDLEPPDIFWAELTVLSNEGNVEDLFGTLAGFLRDDAKKLPEDFNYVAGVAGLIYAQQRGPSVFSIRVGAQILFGQPFAEVAGTVEEVRWDFGPTTGRVLVRDDTGSSAIASETIRTYYYRKDPLDTSNTSGLAINPDTAVAWAEGDKIPQFSPIGGGVDIIDLYNDPTWYLPYVRSGLITEIEKFHYFLVRFNLDLVSLSNLSLLFSFISGVKPTYTFPLLVGARVEEDSIDPIDSLDARLHVNLVDSTCSSGKAYSFDDYRGDGTTWSSFGDASTYYDGLVDCPEDYLEFLLTIAWGGGVIFSDSIFFLDTLVTDVLGSFVLPGGTFMPTYDMSLPAGTYTITAVMKSGGVVLP